jgi:hypothetical protein
MDQNAAATPTAGTASDAALPWPWQPKYTRDGRRGTRPLSNAKAMKVAQEFEQIERARCRLHGEFKA